MVTCLYTPRPPLYSEVPRGHDLLSSCVHVSSLVFQYRVLPGLLLPSQSCLDGQVTLRQVRGLWCSACTVQREELWTGRNRYRYIYYLRQLTCLDQDFVYGHPAATASLNSLVGNIRTHNHKQKQY